MGVSSGRQAPGLRRETRKAQRREDPGQLVVPTAKSMKDADDNGLLSKPLEPRYAEHAAASKREAGSAVDRVLPIVDGKKTP